MSDTDEDVPFGNLIAKIVVDLIDDASEIDPQPVGSVHLGVAADAEDQLDRLVLVGNFECSALR